MTAGTVSYGFALGGALLGLWGVARFPGRGPRTLASAVLVSAAAYGLLLAAGPLTAAALAVAGRSVALLLVDLPLLTFAFWSAAHVVRIGIEQLAPYRR